MTDIFHVPSLSEKAESLITADINTCVEQIKKDQ